MRARYGWVILACWFGCTAPGDRMEVAQAPILGGTAATEGQFPTVVAINVGNLGLCNGTLVASDLILTTADCVWPEVWGYSSQAEVTAHTSVILDALNLLDSGQGRTIAAADTVPHPAHDPSSMLAPDVGLIRLAESITDRTPSLVNRVHDDAPPGIATTLVGFGRSVADDSASAGTLHFLNKSTSACPSEWGSSADLTVLYYDLSDGTGSCFGDGGGPAFATIGGVQKVIGVDSFADLACADYGGFARIDAELDFLDANAPELTCLADGVCVDECGQGDLPDDPDCQPAEGDGDGGGCGCRTSGSGSGATPWFLALLLVAVIGRRRRHR